MVASAAIPGLVKEVTLMQKGENGEAEPFLDFGECWNDGGFKLDLPKRELSQMFNVSFFIVSQVSPAVTAFVMEAQGSEGTPLKGYRGGFLGFALESILAHEIKKWVSIVDDLQLMFWRSHDQVDSGKVFLQETTGDVTIYARRGLQVISDFAQAISVPSRNRVEQCIRDGQRFTFPKICMIRDRMQLDHKLEECEQILLNMKKVKDIEKQATKSSASASKFKTVQL